MTENADETAKGPARSGDAPARRPHATIDLTATEIGRAESGGSRGAAADADRAGSAPPLELPPPSPNEEPERAGDRQRRSWSGAGSSLAATLSAFAGWIWRLLAGGLAMTGASILRLVRGSALLSHMAAGVAGAALTLVAGALLGLLGAGRPGDSADILRRLAAAETALAQRSSLPADAASRLAAAEKRLAGVDEQANAVAALAGAQARLAAEVQALKAGSASPIAVERVDKLEAALVALTAEARQAAPEQLASRLAAVEQSLQGTVERQVMPRLAVVEQGLQAVRKSEGERLGGARQSLLALDMADLKRALGEGRSFASELAAAKRDAGSAVDLSGLDAAAATGVPTLRVLSDDFRRIADAAVDAEAVEPASTLERLMAGARSVVRLRKTDFDPGDSSLEATLWRMEAALKQGDIGEVLAQGKRLPPKAAAVAQDWLQKLAARQAAEHAVAEAEAVLRASLKRQPAGAEPPR